MPITIVVSTTLPRVMKPSCDSYVLMLHRIVRSDQNTSSRSHRATGGGVRRVRSRSSRRPTVTAASAPNHFGADPNSKNMFVSSKNRTKMYTRSGANSTERTTIAKITRAGKTSAYRASPLRTMAKPITAEQSSASAVAPTPADIVDGDEWVDCMVLSAQGGLPRAPPADHEVQAPSKESQRVAPVDHRKRHHEPEDGSPTAGGALTGRHPGHGRQIQAERGSRSDTRDGRPRRRRQQGRPQDQGARGHQLPQREHRAQLPRDQRLEVAVLVVHARQLAVRIARMVPTRHVGDEQDAAAPADEAQVELVILVSRQLRIESTDSLEHIAAVAAEWHRIHELRLGHSQAVPRVSNAQRMSEGQRDRPRDRRVRSRLRLPGAPDVVRPVPTCPS